MNSNCIKVINMKLMSHIVIVYYRSCEKYLLLSVFNVNSFRRIGFK